MSETILHGKIKRSSEKSFVIERGKGQENKNILKNKKWTNVTSRLRLFYMDSVSIHSNQKISLKIVTIILIKTFLFGNLSHFSRGTVCFKANSI